MVRTRLVVIVLAIAAALMGTAGVASAATATVGNTGGTGLNVRAAPTSASSSLGLVWDGRRVDISCQLTGQWITNENEFSSNIWDFVPSLGGYLADAYMNTGHDSWIPGVPRCGDGGGGSFVAVSQFQGQPNQGEDCGPTSVVTALLAAGRTPRSWSASRPVDAINRARRDMGFDPTWNDPNQFGTNEANVVRALGANGVDAWVSYDFDAVLSRVRNGRPAVMAGNMIDLPWSGRNVPHFLTVAGYQNGSYVVLDPATSPYRFTASRATLLAYWSNHLGYAAVVF